MVSTFTPNIQWERPARGDDVGTWDVPVNNNGTLIDLVTGGIATISLNNANIVLSAAQFQSENITFNSTLTGSVTITFPTSFTKPYTIGHFCTGSSANTITLATTAAGGQVIAVPPGQYSDVLNDGTNIKFKNLPHIGSYWDYAASSTPNWNDACTVPPWRNCDGTTFASSIYPVLAAILGSTTFPDARGRTRYALNQTTGRVTTGISGIDGNTIFTGGGNQAMQQHTHGVTDPGHTHTHNALKNENLSATGGGSFGCQAAPDPATINSAVTGISIQNTGGGGSQNMPPVLIAGLTLIRAG
jgi:hypothetical protein